MPLSEPRNMPEQEHSIKSRAHEVFAKETPDTANRRDQAVSSLSSRNTGVSHVDRR